VIDTVSNTVTNTINVDVLPQGLAITPDGAHAYVTNPAANTVSVIKLGSA
jgi:DNA-binding beta-propeller fold protein YncE